MSTIATPQFRTKTGRLTAYSFACGYIEEKRTERHFYPYRHHCGLHTRMWHDSIYHVRQFDYGNDGIPVRVFWHSFETLAEARNCFNRQKGSLI